MAIGGINQENIADILPCEPDMIGVVRDYENIMNLKTLLAR